MKFRRQSREELSVNVTPLIDVVFLLLIFFMVSTTFTKESRLAVELPKSSGEASESLADQIEVVINKDGQYTVNQRVLINSQIATLKRAVEQLSKGKNDLPFIVTADAKTPHEFVVRAMDVAGQLGYQKLSITTQRTEAE
ncbi:MULTISPECIES: ExbD/TolR family protein [unclassified Hahella]|uniref:ExbD/TolR family protein n=1 Tax=unclassified Hahella TaxID=2624107 RepID=UPI001C1EB648|nr:biopolymer transporter ExbD [Hahella sp. CR1]MBU6950576.1 biopolymer transporter ExbD [Hahella sp. HN01]MDG9667883.1 biopolymer transporter ExbD [Hahella sp. CR1]